MKQTMERIKVLLKQDDIQKVFIFPHIMPDGDTVGSAIALHRMVEKLGLKGYIVLNDDIPSNLSFLIDSTVWYRGDSLAHIHPDLSVAVDCGELKLFEDRLDLYKKGKHTLNIDHHLTNSYYAELNLVDAGASSTGELVFDLMNYMGVAPDMTSGEALYAAITTDTGGFRYSNTTPKTFEVCSVLTETGFDFNRLNVEIFQNKPLEKVLLLNRVFETLRLFADGKGAIVSLTEEMMEALAYKTFDTDGIVEFVRDIEGVEVVAMVRYIGSSAYKVSMRSKNDFDVSRIALKFHGGGHKKAAGFKSEKSFEVIEKDLITAIEEAFGDE